MQFVPDVNFKPSLEVPYLEDARASNSAGHSTTKTQAALQREIISLMNDLGAQNVVFVPGTFPTSPKRYGYLVTFNFVGVAGRIPIAGLPIRSETSDRKDKALRQALYLFREYLQGEMNARIFRPGHVPLVPYLLGDGDQTVMEAIVSSGRLPDLAQHAPRLLSAGYTRSAEYLGWWVSPTGKELDEFTAIKRLGEVRS